MSSTPVSIGPATGGRSVEGFFSRLSGRDLRARFGAETQAAPRWLVERLEHDPERGAYVAQEDERVVGVLDFVQNGPIVEFGVVVDEPHRRLGIAAALTETLLSAMHERAPDATVVGYCDRANVPSLRLLTKMGFHGDGAGYGLVRFQRSA